MLGICNGFQALVKLGLVPYGEIREMSAGSPTLTFNNIGRHVSQIVNTRVVSNKSPWFSAVEPGEIHSVAVSHGEGRFYAPEETIKALFANGQVATTAEFWVKWAIQNVLYRACLKISAAIKTRKSLSAA